MKSERLLKATVSFLLSCVSALFVTELGCYDPGAFAQDSESALAVTKAKRFVVVIHGSKGDVETKSIGVIVDRKGLIVASIQATKDKESVTVTLPDGKKAAAKVVFTEAKLRLVAIKLNADSEVAGIDFSDSDLLKPADLVVSFSSPPMTVTKGVFEKKTRIAGKATEVLHIGFPTGPPVNSGPVVDRAGKLVGFITAFEDERREFKTCISSNDIRKTLSNAVK